MNFRSHLHFPFRSSCDTRPRLRRTAGILFVTAVTLSLPGRADDEPPPTTVVVNTNDIWDHQKFDLQEAITKVADGGTIQFDMPAGEDVNLGYQVTIAKNLTIEGPGEDQLTIQRGFVIAVGCEVDITGLTFKHGSKWYYDTEGGGAIANYGTTTVSECTFTLNEADDIRGGAIHNLATLTIDDCLFEDNTADGDSGGAIANDGSLTVENSRFIDNTVAAHGYIEGGAAIDNSAAGTMVIHSNCLFQGNTTDGTWGLGGAIRNEGDAQISDCEFTSNQCTDYGGAIYSTTTAPAELILTDCEFTSNSCGYYGGAVRNKSGVCDFVRCTFTTNTGEYGGAASLEGESTMTDCLLTSNTATESTWGGGGILNKGVLTLEGTDLTNNTSTLGNGGAIFNDAGTLTIDDAGISGNTCPDGEGAGICNNSGSLTIDNAVISDNTAFEGGGGITNRQQGTVTCTMVEIHGNQVTDEYGEGGGISNVGVLSLTDCHVHDNDCTGDSSDGGGIYSRSGYSGTIEADVELLRCTVADNTCLGDGAGIHSDESSSLNATLRVRDSTISGNQALDPDYSSGGGVNCGGVARFVNSTISENSAESGGGIYAYGCEILLAHTTVSANTASYGGGGLYARFDPGSLMTHTILGGNSAPSRPDAYRSTSGSELVSGGHNVVGDMDGFSYTLGTGDLVGAPGLAPLADNGGTTWTHALNAGSLAADAGDPAFDPNAYTPPLTTDQRGEARVSGGGIDIGAFEGGVLVELAVDIFDDIDNGNFDAGDRSLREAVIRANTHSDPVVILLPAGTYPVTDGELLISNTSAPIVIAGAGAAALDAQSGNRILQIAVGSELGLTGLVLRNGSCFGTDDGGALLNHGTLVAEDCEFVANSSADRGGALWNGGKATLGGCRFEDNQSGHDGGSIANTGELTAVGCFFHKCNSSAGAVVLDNTGTANLLTCWIERSQHAPSNTVGATIENESGATLGITNSMLFLNVARGGAVLDSGGVATLRHCSLFGSSGSILDSLRSEGGVLNIGHCMILSFLQNDIDPSSVTSLGYNLISRQVIWTTAAGDIVGETPKANNAYLLPSSRGVNEGDPLFSDPTLTTDIYGHPRVSGGRIDIGAIEIRDEFLSLDDFVTGFFSPEQLADPQVADPGADPDHDGKATRVEAFAGGTPSQSDGTAPVTMVTGDAAPDGPDPGDEDEVVPSDIEFLLDERMTFLRGEVHTSDDLGVWTKRAVYQPLGAGLGYQRTDTGGLTFVEDSKSGYVWTIHESIDDAGDREFVRMVVVEP